MSGEYVDRASIPSKTQAAMSFDSVVFKLPLPAADACSDFFLSGDDVILYLGCMIIPASLSVLACVLAMILRWLTALKSSGRDVSGEVVNEGW